MVGAVYMAVALWVYAFINAAREPRFDYYTPLDAAIPLLPWTILVYVSFYAVALLAIPLLSPARFLRTLQSACITGPVAWLFFWFAPAHYPRPPLETSSAFAPVFEWLYAMDAPGNTFPSLHVASCTLLGLGLSERPERAFWVAWTVAVSVSTLTTKQHYVADVVGGVLLAHGAWWITGRAGASPTTPSAPG
ncbi:MAG: phosphatase PAP2 family protein [Myxococcota bacterium]